MGLFSGSPESEGSHPGAMPLVPPLTEFALPAYDPELLPRLKEEHEELLNLFNAIKSSADRRQFHLLPKLLYRLDVYFHRHITLENAKFYSYVKQVHAADRIESRFIATAQGEIDEIVYQLDRFVNKHLVKLPTAETLPAFHHDLERIAALVIWRLQFEERSLFYLYQP